MSKEDPKPNDIRKFYHEILASIINNPTKYEDFLAFDLSSIEKLQPKLVFGIDENSRLQVVKVDSSRKVVTTGITTADILPFRKTEIEVPLTAAGATTFTVTFAKPTWITMAQAASASATIHISVSDSAAAFFAYVAYINVGTYVQFPLAVAIDATNFAMRGVQIFIPATWKLVFTSANNVTYGYTGFEEPML